MVAGHPSIPRPDIVTIDDRGAPLPPRLPVGSPPVARPTAFTPPRLTRPSGFAGADIALATLVVLVVGLMIVPLPTWALDLLISANLSAAVAILLVVLYVPDAIGIATFPTLLLLTTLFRLGLNVASTRLILL